MKSPKLYILIITILLSTSELFAMEFGGTVGVSFQLSTHANRIGFALRAFVAGNYWQINPAFNYYYNFDAIGSGRSGREMQSSLGAVIGFGEYFDSDSQFLDALSNQTGSLYSVGYAYNVYIDEAVTSQQTGTVSFSAGGFRMATENDMLSFELSDRYRSAAISLEYATKNYRAALASTLWHGDAKNTPTVKNDNYPARYGWRDFSEAHYGRRSVGILAVSLSVAGFNYQQASASIGIDDERVRNFLQNTLIHDMPFIPAGIIKAKNYHYPMLTDDGEPFLYKKEQKIRKSLLYLNIESNTNLFY